MAYPSSSDLKYYVNKPLTKDDWKTNFDKIIEWLTSGNYDLWVNTLTISASGGITVTGFKRVTTAERDALTYIVGGTVVFNTDINMVQYYDGLAWKDI